MRQDATIAKLQAGLSSAQQAMQQEQQRCWALEQDKARLQDQLRLHEQRLADWQQLGEERAAMVKQLSQEQADMMKQANSHLEAVYVKQLQALEQQLSSRCGTAHTAHASCWDTASSHYLALTSAWQYHPSGM